ncbi:MAG: hypothetical protein HYT09_02800 [Candidatus Levybacteria bacterium]|nr:hypothetical protein [Candidatus Levybacteria bacterium]
MLKLKAKCKRASEIHARGNEEPGDMLIFMPGQAEIEKTIDALRRQQNLLDDEVEFIPLIGGSESAESMRKIHAPSDKRRIFIATNVAETSITIPSVRIVIDSGLMRLNAFNPDTGISGLETRLHTKSNAKQRRGRAGRTAPGTVHYLFTKEDLEAREPYLPAEILRTDLVAQVLLMKQMGIADIPNFDFIDHPGVEKINQAIETLRKLGALNTDGSLNETGARMAEINTEPRFARMIVEAEKLGVVDAVSLAVGMLQDPRRDVFYREYRTDIPIQEKYKDYIIPGSDILTRLNIWNEYLRHRGSKEERKEWEETNGFRTFAFFNASNARKDILRNRGLRDEPIDLSPENAAKITQCVAVGLVDNIIRRVNGEYQTLSGAAGIRIDNRNSVLSGTSPDTFLSGNLRRSERAGVFAGLNLAISLEDIKRIAPYLNLALPEKPSTTAETEKQTPVQTEQKTEVSSSTTVAPEPEKQIPRVDYSFSTYKKEKQETATQEKQKRETTIMRLREIIRAWLKKLKLTR